MKIKVPVHAILSDDFLLNVPYTDARSIKSDLRWFSLGLEFVVDRSGSHIGRSGGSQRRVVVRSPVATRLGQADRLVSEPRKCVMVKLLATTASQLPRIRAFRRCLLREGMGTKSMSEAGGTKEMPRVQDRRNACDPFFAGREPELILVCVVSGSLRPANGCKKSLE